MDDRIQRTKTALRNTLIKLMKNKPVGEISVSEITRKAGLDRTTFYYHYKSVGDVLDELIEEQLAQFSTMLDERQAYGERFLREMLKSIDKAKKLYSGEVSEKFKNGLIATAKEHGIQAWKERLPQLDGHEAEIIYEALVAGALQIALSDETGAGRRETEKIIMDMGNAYIRFYE